MEFFVCSPFITVFSIHIHIQRYILRGVLPIQYVGSGVLVGFIMHGWSEMYVVNGCHSGVVNWCRCWCVFVLDFRACLGCVLGCITRPLIRFRLHRLISLRILQKVLHLLLDMRRLNRRFQQPGILFLPWRRVKILGSDLTLRLQILKKFRVRGAIKLDMISIFNWLCVLVLVSVDVVGVLVCLLADCWVSFLLKVVLLSNCRIPWIILPCRRFLLFVYIYCYDVDFLRRWWLFMLAFVLFP